MVASLVTERMKQIHQICRKYQVERLHLFGSAANGPMRPTETWTSWWSSKKRRLNAVSTR